MSRYIDPVKDYKTLDEIATMLELKDTSTLRWAIKRGALQAERAGKRTFIVANEEVERYRRENHGKRGKASAAYGQSRASTPPSALTPPEEMP